MADRGRHHPQLDGGAGRTEVAEDGGQPVVRRVALGAEPDQLAPADRAPADLLLHGIQLAQHGTRRPEQSLAGLGGAHPAPGAQEQCGAEPLLEGTEGVAYGGLGEPEPRRGRGEIAAVGDRGEESELAGLEIGHVGVTINRMHGNSNLRAVDAHVSRAQIACGQSLPPFVRTMP